LLLAERKHRDYGAGSAIWVLVLMANEDIYGRDPDGGAKAAAAQALRRMGAMSETDEAEKNTGKEASNAGDMVDEAKP
jgi:hypothetical protein